MQRGLLASTLVGVLCAVVGCYVVLRGMAFLGDALAHAILPGVAIAYLLNGNLLIGALVAAIVVAMLHRLLVAAGHDQGRYRHRHFVCGGAVAGRVADQHHPHVCGRSDAHPVRQRTGREHAAI